MSSYGRRIAGITIATAIVCIAIGLYVGLYLTNVPGSAAAQQTPVGTSLYLATVPTAEANDPHSTWVSYYAVNAQATTWSHATTYVLPANSLVHVTIYEFDTQTGLRNPFISQATGTVGGTFLLNGKPTVAIDPDTASHVFAIPEIGLSVPLMGPGSSAKNLCSQAPCALNNAHETISFTFRTPAKGLYRWQCFVPCAAGFIQGLGGPMQTVGYMDGFIKVV
ncbi:MAG: hypothetical protein JO325_12925 [Solirubrobacterales bacterium]|nr:hypothetical protein [Solirubrobacterales bacterium]